LIYDSLCMQTIETKTTLCVLIAGMLSVLGCTGPNKTASVEPTPMICEDGVTKAQVIEAAEHVLTGMHFPIEKLDVEQGVIRTRPLRGGQFFEFWRSDNASSDGCQEANLQSIRRSVELRVVQPLRTADCGLRIESTASNPQSAGLQPVASGLRIECEVAVQRLSLPGNEVAGTSQAYVIHSRSTPTLQRLELTPQQQRAMAWIDLGQDPDLAVRILRRVAKRLEHAD
jgi:hypothetical protein